MAKKRKDKVVSKPATTAPTSESGTPEPAPATSGSEAPVASSPDRTSIYVIGGLLAVCILLYGQTAGFNFITIDDGGYVFENPVVAGGLSWQALKWAFATFSQANWHPLTWVSLLIDTSLFGVRPGAYHLVNAAFHALNSIMLYLLVKRMTGSIWRSAIVAAIFAIHPAHVESVAWISERKDVLSTFFWLLATFFYVRYAHLKANAASLPKERRVYYWLSFGAMALGILAKPMLVTLPFTLLLLDYWPLNRIENLSLRGIGRLVVEKLPLFALSVVSSVITVIAQERGGAMVTLTQLPFTTRAANAVVAYAKYFATMFYPVDLGLTYPYQLALPKWQIALSALMLAAITILSLFLIKEKKYLAVGWFWFLGTMIPVIGLVQVGAQALADRYTYIPYIGLSIAIVWLVDELLLTMDRRVVAAAAGLILLLLGVLAFQQIRLWRSSEALFLHTVAVTDRNGFIEHGLCRLYLNQNRLEAAEERCNLAIEYSPQFYVPQKLMGAVNFKQGQLDQAAAHFLRALQFRPDDLGSFTEYTKPELDRGVDVDKVAELIDKISAAANGPDASPDARVRTVVNQVLLQNYGLLAWTYLKQDRYDRAAEYFGKALKLSPPDAELRSNYGLMLYRAGHKTEGINELRESIRMAPDKPESHNTLGIMLSAEGQRDEAIKEIERALELKPDYTAARNNLEKLRSQQ